METTTSLIYLKLFIFYGSWLVFPLLYWFASKRWKILIVLSLLFIYARFVEPQILLVNYTKIHTGFHAKYALISDMHLGIYNNESILERAVDKINSLDVDALLIAGDFTYEPQFDDMRKLFASLAKVKVPVYAVLGNHDCEKPGPKIAKELTKILEGFGVSVLDNKSLKLNNVNILGLGSRCAYNDKRILISKYKKEDNLLVLAHHPDVTLDYNISKDYPDLTVVGHTHGGQIRIPFLYQSMISIRGNVAKGDILWNQGLYAFKNSQVFVTSGMGEIGLPMRFLIPPVIDILELY